VVRTTADKLEYNKTALLVRDEYIAAAFRNVAEVISEASGCGPGIASGKCHVYFTY
jgi:hypothetical protein